MDSDASNDSRSDVGQSQVRKKRKRRPSKPCSEDDVPITEGFKEIKKMLRSLTKKVDRNEKVLKEIQEARLNI